MQLGYLKSLCFGELAVTGRFPTSGDEAKPLVDVVFVGGENGVADGRP